MDCSNSLRPLHLYFPKGGDHWVFASSSGGCTGACCSLLCVELVVEGVVSSNLRTGVLNSRRA